MPAIEALAAILGIIVAALTIYRSLRAPKTPASATEEPLEGKFTTVHSLTVPPPLSRAEFERQVAAMPVEWIVYEGSTPPLKLKIRGISEALYRQFARRHIGTIGEDIYNRMTPEQQRAVTRAINAELYVLDWDDARYANGNKIPFSAPSLELLLQKDPDLEAFLNGQIRRISAKLDA
jgi:hypothetical protein